MSNFAPGTYKLLGWYIQPLRLFLICKKNGQAEESHLVFVSFFFFFFSLLTQSAPQMRSAVMVHAVQKENVSVKQDW